MMKTIRTQPGVAVIATLAITLAGLLPATAASAGQAPQVRRVIAYPLEVLADPGPALAQGAGVAPRSRFEAAPVPNRDVDSPVGPRASNDPQLSPTLFNRRDQYRGEGIAPNSSSQIDQERKLRPGAGFTLKMPLQQ